jgi:FkbM family methyltransferase
MQPTPTDILNAIGQLQKNVAYLESQVLNLRQKAAALEVRERLAARGKTTRLPFEFRSQFGEDLAIHDMLGEKDRGFYIEVGAFDGRSISVTWFLDALGWDGLLVEALPDRAESCRRNRPNARVVHAALGRRGSSGTTSFSIVEGGPGPMHSYLSTTFEHQQSVAQSGATVRLINVPLTTMDALLESHPTPVERVDVAVIDVEGGELDLLDGFDLERWKPRIMIIEDNSMGRDPRLERWMASRPYDMLAWIMVNRVYVRRGDAEITARLAALRSGEA